MITEHETTTEVDATNHGVECIERVFLSLVDANESDTARIQAAKIVPERLSRGEDANDITHNGEDRDAAYPETCCRLDGLTEAFAARDFALNARLRWLQAVQWYQITPERRTATNRFPDWRI